MKSRHDKSGWNHNNYLKAAVFMIPVVFIGYFFIINWLEVRQYRLVNMASSDLRTFETGLETYLIDNGTLMPQSGTWLTTPITYISEMHDDVFARGKKGSRETQLNYMTDGKHFLIWSVGPDRKSQISDISDMKNGLDALLQKTYDPTNGAISAGDVWRSNLPSLR